MVEDNETQGESNDEEEVQEEPVDYTQMTKAQLLEAVQTLASAKDDSDLRVMELEERGSDEEIANSFLGVETSDHDMNLPSEVARWLSTSRGRKIDPNSIYIQDRDGTRITYRIVGDSNVWGITLKPDGSMVDPSPHVHEYHSQFSQGVRQSQVPKICTCGILEDSKSGLLGEDVEAESMAPVSTTG